MLSRSLASRSLGCISILKTKGSARSYFVQAQRSPFARDEAPSSSFPRRSSSSSSTVASLPPPGSPSPGQPPPAYPSKDKVLVLLDHDFFAPNTASLSPSLLSRALREFGLLYGRAISSTRMYCLSDAKDVLGFVNAAIEVRAFGSIVSKKADAASQMIISDIWVFAIDNPGATIAIFTRDPVYSNTLNQVAARGCNVVVVSDLNLAATPLAGAGVFIDVQEFRERWPITDAAFQKSLSSTSPTSKIPNTPSSSTLAKTSPSGNTSSPISQKPLTTPTKDLQAFDSMVDALSNLSSLSNSSSSATSLGSTRAADALTIRTLLSILVPDILVGSKFKSISTLVTAHSALRKQATSSLASSSSSTVPEEVSSLPEALYRIAKAFVALPNHPIGMIRTLVPVYFPELASEGGVGSVKLAKALNDALRDGWLRKEAHGGYVPGLDPRGKEGGSVGVVEKEKLTDASPPVPPFLFVSSKPSSSSPGAVSPSPTPSSSATPTSPIPATTPTYSLTSNKLHPIPIKGYVDSHLAFQLRGLVGFLQISKERPALLLDENASTPSSSTPPPKASSDADPPAPPLSPGPTPPESASEPTEPAPIESTSLDIEPTTPTPPSPPPKLTPAAKSVVAKKGKLVWD